MYECEENCGGWADRIKGIFTTYALSILTNRQLLLKIEKPCKLEKSILPNEIDWRMNASLLHGISMFNYFIYWDFHFVKEHFLNTDFTNFHPGADFIIVRTGLDLLQHLTVNPKHHSRLKESGYEISKFNLENILEEWFRKLFKYNDDLETKYNEMLKLARPTANTKLIFAQVRLGGGRDFEFLQLNQTKNYWNFIREKFLNNIKYSYKLFVTSDSKLVIDDAYEEFGEENLMGFRNHSNHIDLIENTENDDQCKQISELYLDFRILSQCDMAVISQSNFGIYGIMNRKKRNFDDFYIYSNIDNISKQFTNRSNLIFSPFNTSYAHLEDMNHFMSILKF